MPVYAVEGGTLSVPLGGREALLGPATIDTTGLTTGVPWYTPLDGRNVSYARLFAEQVWVGAAVMRLMTWAVRVPLKVYRRGADGERERLRPGDHDVARAVLEPWAGGTMADLVTGILGGVLVHGNTAMEITSGRRLTLRLLDWRRVEAIRSTPGGPIDGWKEASPTPGEPVRVLAARDVAHFRWWNPLGDLGVSPLQQLGTTIASEQAAARFAGMHLTNAARPSGVVTMEDRFLGLEPAERQALLDRLTADIRSAYSGPQNAGKVAVLPPGLSWSSAEFTTAVEAQLIEQRRINREEIAAIYQIPPPMLGILDHANYNNVEAARQMAYTDALAPQLIVIEQRLNASVLREALGLRDVWVEFDFSGILRGDRLKEVQALREAISIGLLTPNEGRDIDNRARYPHEAADQLYLPTNNLSPIGGTVNPGEAPR